MWTFGKARFSELLLLLLRWCLVSLYAYFGWHMSLMLVVVCLTWLFTLSLSLLMATCLLSCYGLFMRIHYYFTTLGMLMVYNCSNTYLYALWSTVILDLMYSISFFSRFMFDEFIVQGGEYGHKVDWTLANQVVERRNMINVYLRGRACIQSVRGSFEFFNFEPFFALFLGLSLFVSFIGLAVFSSSRWPSWAFRWILVF
jgi:hypothetical protein